MYICTYIHIYHRQISPHPAFGRPCQAVQQFPPPPAYPPQNMGYGSGARGAPGWRRVGSWSFRLSGFFQKFIAESGWKLIIYQCGRFWRTKKTYENLWMHHIGAPADPNLWVYHRFPSFSPVFPLEACPIDGAVLQRPTAEHAAFPVGVTQLMFFSSWKARAIAAETVVTLIF